MENYKIKVNNEAESREVQKLFFELGFYWIIGLGVKNLDAKFLYAKNNKITMGYYSSDFSDVGYREITIEELRDMVSSQRKPTEQGLISGADAKLAWAKGENVQISHKHATLKKEWHDLYGTLMLSAFDSDMYEFRIKPHTIKLELEIPAPFEPKEGEKAYRLAPAIPCGYTEFYLEEDEYEHQFGAWRTELEIKQVVAALREAIKLG